MTRALLVGAAAAALAVGALAGWFAAKETEETETTTVTATREAAPDGLPAAVEESRRALLQEPRAATTALRSLIPSDGFEYTFGDAVEGGPTAYWQELERTTDERPLETLATILKLPHVLSRGIHVWPWAYAAERASDLSLHERELLAPLGPIATLFPAGSGYYGWRAGIEPDGTWTFFVAGD